MIKDLGKLSLFYVAVFILCMLASMLTRVALADFVPDPRGEQSQTQGQDQTQSQRQSNYMTAAGGRSESTADNDLDVDLDLSEHSNVENNSSNIVLVPNNNTESCLRVFGISWGDGDGAGALGIPWRAKACDFEQAADDAASTGNHSMAWYWRCHKKNIHRTFKRSGEKVKAKTLVDRCHEKMVSLLDVGSLQSDYEALQQRYDALFTEFEEANDYAVEQRQRLEESCEARTTRAMEACGK